MQVFSLRLVRYRNRNSGILPSFQNYSHFPSNHATRMHHTVSWYSRTSIGQKADCTAVVLQFSVGNSDLKKKEGADFRHISKFSSLRASPKFSNIGEKGWSKKSLNLKGSVKNLKKICRIFFGLELNVKYS